MDTRVDRVIIELLMKNAREGKKYTSKKEIQEHLRENFERGFSSNTVGRYLRRLVDDERSGVKAGSAYKRKIVANGLKDDQEVVTGYYYENDISDVELRYLIDCVLYSRIMEPSQGRELIRKLQNLSGKTLIQDTSYINNIKEEIYIANKETLNNVQILQDAIREQKKVSFVFNGCNTEKKLVPLYGKARCFHPYQIVFSNGRYYLMAASDSMVKKGEYHLYRIDLLTEVEKTSAAANRIADVFEVYTNRDLIRLTRENPYMFSGKPQEITLRVKKSILVQIVDWFGKNFEIIKDSETKETLDIKVEANPNAMLYWVLQYSLNLEVLKPDDFREKVKESINSIKKKYDD